MLAKKKASGGAPEWALTYGDMMSLLLCFFILLAAFADYDKGGSSASAAMVEAMQSIQQALGLPVRRSPAHANMTEFNALVERVSQAVQNQNAAYRNNTEEKGVVGKNFRLRRIRDGMEITVGGPIMFEPFSRTPTAEGREAIKKLGNLIKGHRNKLDVIGHAAEQSAPTDWKYADAMQLSYERAKLVGDELIAIGVDPQTIRLVAAGPNEPTGSAKDGSLEHSDGDNRRVEIIVRESLIDDYQAVRAAQRSSVVAAQTQPASNTVK